jgi:hypothetical protein
MNDFLLIIMYSYSAMDRGRTELTFAELQQCD